LFACRTTFGVLSVYVDADPRQQAVQPPAWTIAVQNGLSEIRERVGAGGERARRSAVLKRLELLENELSLVLDPRQPGRGRALFATIERGEVHRFAFQVSLPTRVVLDDRAYLAPLVAALDRGRPAGLIAVSLSAVRVVEQRLGVASEVTTFALEPETSEWRERKGPAASNPALAQQTAPQRDLFERRLEEHRRRLLEDAGGRLRALAESQRWDRIVVAGDPRLAHVLGDALRGHDSDISVVESVLHGLSPSEIAEAVAPERERVSLRREEELVRRACDAALSGGRGAHRASRRSRRPGRTSGQPPAVRRPGSGPGCARARRSADGRG
jgi:hypothetical protein